MIPCSVNSCLLLLPYLEPRALFGQPSFVFGIVSIENNVGGWIDKGGTNDALSKLLGRRC